MLDPVKKTIEVPCSADEAFKIFVERVATWWPLDKNSVSAMNGNVAKEVTIENKLGGRVFELGHDDTIHEWGSVTGFEPGKVLRLDWHIGLPSSSASDVEVRFTDLSDGRCRVDLSHSRWEAFADKAEAMRNGYNQGWVGVFEQAFAQACSA